MENPSVTEAPSGASEPAAAGAAPEPTPPVRELKFSLAEGEVERLVEALRPIVPPDPHALGVPNEVYRVASLYFDTSGFDVFHRAAGGDETKYRVRRYGDGEGGLFLEEKRKSRGLVRKRRTRIAARDAGLLAPRTDGGDGDAARWFLERVRALALGVVCEIAYERWAREGTIEGVPVRVTVDRGVRCLPAREPLFAGAGAAAAALEIDARILEMKFPQALPAALKRIVRDFSLRPAGVSKYRLAVARSSLAGGGGGARP